MAAHRILVSFLRRDKRSMLSKKYRLRIGYRYLFFEGCAEHVSFLGFTKKGYQTQDKSCYLFFCMLSKALKRKELVFVCEAFIFSIKIFDFKSLGYRLRIGYVVVSFVSEGIPTFEAFCVKLEHKILASQFARSMHSKSKIGKQKGSLLAQLMCARIFNN